MPKPSENLVMSAGLFPPVIHPLINRSHLNPVNTNTGLQECFKYIHFNVKSFIEKLRVNISVVFLNITELLV